jgi:Family of unknown function (DUF5994)
MINVRSDSYADPLCRGRLEAKEAIHGSHGLAHRSPCLSTGFAACPSSRQRLMTTSTDQRRLRSPVRFTLTSDLGSGLDGAWWPYSVSIARELSDLADAVQEPLGSVIDIGVNWSPLQGVQDFDLLNRRGVPALPGQESRQLRIMTITGSRARAHLLVVPFGTSNALAVMVLRQAAGLPVRYEHQHTAAFDTAGVIVRTAREQITPAAAAADNSS